MTEQINVAELRAAMGVTQKKLAEIIGCDDDTVYRWERGQEPTKYKHVKKLMELQKKHLTTP